MIQLLVGQTGTGKTTVIKDVIANKTNKQIIFDYNNQYDGYTDHILSLDEINPLLSPLDLTDIKALNAGFLEYSHLLYKKSEDVLWDHARNLGKNTIEDIKAMRLVEDTVERLQNSWEPNESEKGNELKPLIMLRKNKEQMNLEEVIEYIKKHDKILFKTKSLHSDQVRALTYIILSAVSRSIDETITVVSDNLTTVFNQANAKLFIQTIDMAKFDFVISYNRFSNLAKSLEEFVSEYLIFRFDTNADIKELEKLYFGSKASSEDKEDKKEIAKFRKSLKTLKNGDYFTKTTLDSTEVLSK